MNINQTAYDNNSDFYYVTPYNFFKRNKINEIISIPLLCINKNDHIKTIPEFDFSCEGNNFKVLQKLAQELTIHTTQEGKGKINIFNRELKINLIVYLVISKKVKNEDIYPYKHFLYLN